MGERLFHLASDHRLGRTILVQNRSPEMPRYTPRKNDWADVELVEALCRQTLEQQPQVVRRLEGGFSNVNYALDDKFVLRLYAQGQEAALRESKILEIATWHGIPTPSIVKVGSFEDYGFLLSELVPGRLLDDKADFADVGAHLAKVHSLSFGDYGFFETDGELRSIPRTLGEEIVSDALNGRAGRRLGPERILALSALEPPQPHPLAPSLVHCDFNPKNILINDEGKVTAILDWEFAMVGDPLIDLGNFFRFPEDYAPQQMVQFESGYREAGGILPPDWKRQAQLHDLVSLVSFLDRPEDHPETFATALDRIDALLAV